MMELAWPELASDPLMFGSIANDFSPVSIPSVFSGPPRRALMNCVFPLVWTSPYFVRSLRFVSSTSHDLGPPSWDNDQLILSFCGRTCLGLCGLGAGLAAGGIGAAGNPGSDVMAFSG